MSAILLDEKVVHYEVLGRGRPIIFLHGWVGSWRYWIPAMQTAAVSFRTYALDLWGFGDSARNPAGYSLAKQTLLLDQFLQAMGIGRVALVGHGLGGLVALLFAHKYPAIVDRMMLVNVPLATAAASTRLRNPASPADLADWLLAKGPVSEPVRTDAPRADPLAISTSFADLDAVNLPAQINALSTACLVVHGTNDPATSPQSEASLLTLPSAVHQVPFDASGHFPMLDESSAFNRLLVDFLALESGDSPRQLELKDEWKRRVR